MNDILFGKGRGNPEFANLPRKFNICISSTRDDFPHTQINDLGFEAVKDPASGKILFNVVVGGLFSTRRNMMSIPLEVAVTEEQVIPFSLALLRVFRYVSCAPESHAFIFVILSHVRNCCVA